MSAALKPRPLAAVADRVDALDFSRFGKPTGNASARSRRGGGMTAKTALTRPWAE